MNINEVAKISRVSVPTIKEYVRLKLLKPNKQNGLNIYTHDMIAQIIIIKKLSGKFTRKFIKEFIIQ